MLKTVLICLTCLIQVQSAWGQDRNDYQTADQLQRQVTLLLLDKPINEVTRQFDSESPSTVASLFLRLMVYGRAGQSARVRKTLEQLPATGNWTCPGDYALRRLIKNADGNSIGGQRFYYERLCPDDIEGAEGFVTLWANTGDAKELDTWLAERSSRNDVWLMQRVRLRAQSGTAGEVLDELAAEIRSNPSDWVRLNRYLNANNYARNLQDVSWLADTFEVTTAVGYFQLAEHLRPNSPRAALRLLQKSLSLPFTEADAKQVEKLLNQFRSAGPSIKVNWEKQLRYWTKRSLAEVYQTMNQSLAAQPLVEELVSITGDDILLGDVHQLAGAVQGGSGQRVVETKILRDETARRSTAEYWLERARYYDGRVEFELERNTFRQALVALEARPDDIKGLRERFEVVRSFAWFLARHENKEAEEVELEKTLTRELRSVPPETDYAFEIASLITQSELDLNELRNALLAKQPLFLARLLDGRREWGNSEMLLIENVVHQDGVTPEMKDRIWSTLTPLVRHPGSTRAFFLAAAMKWENEWQRAIPFWRGYIDHALPTNWEGYKSDAISDLFKAYCQTKQWQAAEKFLWAQREAFWHRLPNALAEVAVVAAQQNAIDDAMRLWRISTNLDRRNLDVLTEMARTQAKPQLVAMYTQMKKEDPISTIPNSALRVLE